MAQKPIVVSKIGYQHAFAGTNRQDVGVMFDSVKLCLDGCTSGQFSEIGAGLFAQALRKRKDITAANFDHVVYEEMHRLIDGLKFSAEDLLDNFCFTILAVIETDDEFTVYSCGDGYIFAVKDVDNMDIISVDHGYNNTPPYFVYNFIEPELLTAYKDGVRFEVKHFPKATYSNVGIGSDGYSYIGGLSASEQDQFNEALRRGMPWRVGQIINRNSQAIEDDITVVL